MTVSVAVGARIDFASTLGTAITSTVVSNAADAVVTIGTGHGLSSGGYVVVNSGWTLLNGRAARISATDGTSVTLEDIDTSDTDSYPAGAGTGSVQDVSAWTQITQIGGVDTAGGDQNYADSSTLDDVDDKQIPTSRSATTYNFTVHDDPTLSWYATLRAVADAAEPRPLRLTKPGGGKWLANGYWSFGENPQLSRTESTKVRVGFSTSARPINYAT